MTAPLSLRLWKFSLVGGIGIGVQLAALATLTAMGVNYLLATVVAVECAILHNFVWHQRFTWADRTRSTAEALRRLLRFHVSNGLISLVGNMTLMRWLVGGLRAPILMGNVLTISICALANFVVSDCWVFAVTRVSSEDGVSFWGRYSEVPRFHQRGEGSGEECWH
jgi:putative flippase GtrA